MDADMTDELERLLAGAQTHGPWQIVRYGDDDMPALAIHWSEADRICFMPTIRHPADEIQFEANAALIVAAVNALPELLKAVRRVGELEALLAEAQPLVAAMEFLESRAYHYGRSYDEPSPAEWGISVSYQETRDMNPGAQFDADITEYHRQNLEEDDEDEPGQFLSLANRIARAALKGSGHDETRD